MGEHKSKDLGLSEKHAGGRPRKGGDQASVKKSVSLKQETWEHLLVVGEGVLSEGVERVTAFHMLYSTRSGDRVRTEGSRNRGGKSRS